MLHILMKWTQNYKMDNLLPGFFIYWISVTLIHADPQWRIRPTDQSVQIGHNVTFLCEVDDIEGVGIVWQRGEKILFLNHLRHNAPVNYYITGDQSHGQFNMEVTNVQQSDDDVYKCSVGQSSLKQSVQLTVIVPPSQPSLSLSVTGQLTAGQTVSFTCTSSGGNPPPVISWSLNGQPITTGYTVSPPEVKFGETRSVLTRQLTRSDHGSEMRCFVENSGNQGSPVYTNTVLQVQYGPYVTVKPSNVIRVIEHENATLWCNVDANPAVSSVQWFMGGVLQQETGFSFHIAQTLSAVHSTVYECVADNKITEGRNLTTIDVIYPPKITIPKSTNGFLYVNESSDVNISCLVDANPKAEKTEWVKSRSSSVVSGSLLSIKNVNRHQTGTYICQSSNVLAATGSAVQSVSRNQSLQLVVQYPPVVSVKVSKVAVDMNQTVTLECHAHSVPRPNFRWFHLTKELTTGGRYNISSVNGSQDGTSLLHVSNVGLSDVGEYVCVAANVFGNVSATIRLVMKTIPETPAGLMVRGNTWESVLLEWSPQFDGGYAQTFVIYYTSPTEQSKHTRAGSLVSFNVTELFPSTEYTFCVFAENSLGRSSYSRGVNVKTDDFTVPPPSSAVYDPAQQIVTFSSPSDHFCVRIFISADTSGHWELYEPCAPSTGGSVKISADLDTKLVNLSLCLARRNNVCSASVLAKNAPSAGSSVELIIVGCVCGLIITALIISLAVVWVRRQRNTTNKGDSKLMDRINNQNNMNTKKSLTTNGISNPTLISSSVEISSHKITTSSSDLMSQSLKAHGNGFINNTSDNAKIHSRPPKKLYTQKDANHGQLHAIPKHKSDHMYSRQHSGHHGNVAIGYQNQSKHSDHDHYRKKQPTFSLGSIDSFSHLGVDVGALNKKNQHGSDSPNSDMNSSADSVEPLSSNSSQGIPKCDSGGHGNDSESGYSTPDSSKPKKVVYEVIV